MSSDLFHSRMHPSPIIINHIYKISRSLSGGERIASIISVSDIRRNTHHIPNCGAVILREWTSATVLDTSTYYFFVNPFLDRRTYLTSSTVSGYNYLRIVSKLLQEYPQLTSISKWLQTGIVGERLRIGQQLEINECRSDVDVRRGQRWDVKVEIAGSRAS
jgi:hypothetical protein